MQNVATDIVMEKSLTFGDRKVSGRLAVVTNRLLVFTGHIGSSIMTLLQKDFPILLICQHQRRDNNLTWQKINAPLHSVNRVIGSYDFSNNCNTISFDLAQEEWDDSTFCVVYIAAPSTYAVIIHIRVNQTSKTLITQCLQSEWVLFRVASFVLSSN